MFFPPHPHLYHRIFIDFRLKIFINAPPTNPNVQELPKSVLEMNRLRELVRSGKFKNNKKKKKIETTNQLDSSNFINTGPKLPGNNCDNW